MLMAVFFCPINCPRATKPNFKSRPKSQEIVHGQQNQILKSRPKSQEIVHGQQNQILKSRPKSQEIV